MKKTSVSCATKSCFLCKTCLPEWIPAIEAHKQTFQYKRGESIFTEGEAVTGIFFVQSGTVKVHKKWGAEKELIIRFAKGGDIIGHRGLGGDLHYPVTGTALETTVACFIDLSFFEATLQVNTGFTTSLLMFYAAELQLSERKMNNMAHMQVKGRVAFSLLNLHEKFGENADGAIDLSFSRQELASFAGTTYETVFRTLNEMVAEALISLDSKSIRLLNKTGLQQLIRDDLQ